ncbi:MAG: hypothetical protein KGK11_07670 [Sphingomonadales bacterium]|nr:hypothetical protein [Sphingomonadales bacterium]
MKGLSHPQGRRALLALIEAVVALGLLALVWRITGLVATDSRSLVEVARGALGILALGTLFYGLENVSRTFRLQLGPAEIVAAGNDQPATDRQDCP